MLRRIVLWLMGAGVAALVLAGTAQLAREWSAVQGDDLQSLVPTSAQLAVAWDTHRADILGVYLPNTLRVTLIGLAIAITLGLLLATLMDFFPPLRWTLYPVLIVSQTVPTFAIAVILILLFGFGDGPKIIVVVLFCFFAVTTNTLDGLRGVDQTYVDLVRTMGASPLAIWWKVRLPAALPNFFGGVRLATTYSVVGAVIGEYVGSGEGMGKFLQRSYRSFQTDQVFLAVAIIAGLSVLLVALVTLTEMLTLRWRYIGQTTRITRFIQFFTQTDARQTRRVPSQTKEVIS
ncbi:MAG: ABC transporter permease [Chloroflexota bacterium]